MNNIRLKIIDFYNDNYGKDLRGFNDSFFDDILEKRMKELNINNYDTFITRLFASEDESEIFLNRFIINHSDFFRGSLTFSALENNIIPSIIDSKGENNEIRVWSAGCSFGQEPYSIAMLFDYISKEMSRKIKVRIFATDFSEEALKRGKRGIYKRNELSKVRLEFFDNYFTEKHKLFQISSNIKDMVSFSHYDLLDSNTANPPDSIYGGFDLILCRNLLIYYNEAAQRQIVEKLNKALIKDGYLISGRSEAYTVKTVTRLQHLCMNAPVFKKEILTPRKG